MRVLVATIAMLLAWPASPASYSFSTAHYRLDLDRQAPRVVALGVDSLGAGKVEVNPVRPSPPPQRAAAWHVRAREDVVDYGDGWSFSFKEKSIAIRSRFVEGAPADPLVLRFDPKVNHATLLGLMPARRQVALPCLLHLPDLGTFRITADLKDARLGYDARRFVPEPFVEVTFPAATKEQSAVTYTLEVVALHPPLAGRETDRRYDAFRRNFLNVFQLNPRLGVLANHAASDPVAFTVYKYADMAAAPGLPELAEKLTALDLVRATLERYLAGMKGYGLVGYRRNMEEADTLEWASTFDALDALPSLLSASCTYATAARDLEWARRNWGTLVGWADRMLAADRDGNGLLEYGLSGNSGSWSGKGDARPSNWWDQIGFGHEDAYANALAYRALVQLAAMARGLGEERDAGRFSAAAGKLKAAYLPAFYSKDSGLLAGWKSADGRLHDYGFTFVTSCAVCWDVVEGEDARRLMGALVGRLAAVKYTDYRLGLPGNLAPVRRGDYVTLKARWGGPEREDGSDTFGVFANGGATHCFVYFTIKALYKVGRREEARGMLYPMLESLAAGEFQGRCANGHSKEWKDWRGNCWGYEGLLVDGYLTLLAVIDD
jgi:hypothetical protein